MDKDHEILHYFEANPNEATTRHPLVKMGMYGISSAIAYQQDLLTKEQIADMHAEWVKQYEPVGHKTPMEIPTTKEKVHTDRWDEVVIRHPDTKAELTKKDVYRYYADPNVKKKIFDQIANNPIMIRQGMNPTENWVKRNPVIKKNVNDPSDISDLEYYISRRHLEFNKTMPEITDRLVIDLDPGIGLELADVKKVTRYLEQLLGNQPYIKDVTLQFSGNRGIHVWAELTNKANINTLREQLKTLLTPIKTMNGVNVTLRQSPGAKSIRLDLSSMKELGAIKAESSLDARTGYISKEILSSQLDSFDPEMDAKVDVDSLKPVYSIRDETLV